MQALPVAIYTVDGQGRITFFNEAAAELWGHRPVIGRDLW
ncbi:MAG: PAS domain-containing protein, partial [Mesorhizobium sp.]